MSATDPSVSRPLVDPFRFPIEDIVRYSLPGFDAPTWVSFSPDDSMVTYVSTDQTLNKNVIAFNLNDGKQELFFSAPDGGLDENNLFAEETLKRKRSREPGLEVTGYEWLRKHATKKRIMVYHPAGIYFQELHQQPELRIASTLSSPLIDPRISPDGTKLAYVRYNELHVLNLLKNELRQVTVGADGNNITHGLAEYIAREEMGRKNGYWWSLTGKFLAFTEVDSSEVPLFRIMHQGKSSVGSEAQEDHSYPFAGGPNVKVRLGVVSATGGCVTWMDLLCGGKNQENDEEYLARVNWMWGDELTAQVLNRSHSKLKLLKFDIKTGHRRILLEEEHETWINLHDCFTPLCDGLFLFGKSLCDALNRFHRGFIWASEKTGFRHLYLHDSNGACVGPITQGDWMVEQVAGVREATGLVYFTGTLDGPLESHLYLTSIVPEPNCPVRPIKLTQEKGKHVVVLDHQMQRFVDICDSLDSPPKIYFCSLVFGAIIMPPYDQPFRIPRFRRFLHLQPPEIIKIPAKDGTTLYGALYKPNAAKFGPPPYKTMIHVYGGPGIQLVSDSFVNTVDMSAQYLKSKGILVWKMDNRGTSRRGLKFEGALKYNCGHIDAEDQLSGAEYLIKEGLAKVGHIGVYGQGYGGYLSAMCLVKYPEVFGCAVSVAPVTSWDGYDTFHAEKYMGLPSENPSGYVQSSVMHHVHSMKGKLLLVHGMIDENVHFRHTARLVNALAAAGKPYELLIFPDERQMPRSLGDCIYMENRIRDFIDRSL